MNGGFSGPHLWCSRKHHGNNDVHCHSIWLPTESELSIECVNFLQPLSICLSLNVQRVRGSIFFPLVPVARIQILLHVCKILRLFTHPSPNTHTTSLPQYTHTHKQVMKMTIIFSPKVLRCCATISCLYSDSVRSYFDNPSFIVSELSCLQLTAQIKVVDNK